MVIADFSGKFLNTETAKDKDLIEITGECVYTEKEWQGKKAKSLDIPVKNGQKELIYTPTFSCGKKLVKAFGEDTAKWLNQKFQINFVKIKKFGQLSDEMDIEPIIAKKP